MTMLAARTWCRLGGDGLRKAAGKEKEWFVGVVVEELKVAGTVWVAGWGRVCTPLMVMWCC